MSKVKLIDIRCWSIPPTRTCTYKSVAITADYSYGARKGCVQQVFLVDGESPYSDWNPFTVEPWGTVDKTFKPRQKGWVKCAWPEYLTKIEYWSDDAKRMVMEAYLPPVRRRRRD